MNAMLLAGSLVAIIAMTLAARWLGLGAAPHISGADHARRIADEAHCGFQPIDVAVSQDGTAALLRDRADRLMVIRPHGNHFVSRLLLSPIPCGVEEGRITLNFAEYMFGGVTLDLGDEAASWARKIQHMGEKYNA